MPHAAKIATCYVQPSICVIKCWKKILRRVVESDADAQQTTAFLDANKVHPKTMEHLPLIQVTRYWSYNKNCKGEKWKK